MKTEQARKLIDTFGYAKLREAHRLNRVCGEGPAAIADYTGIPLRLVDSAISAGDFLFRMAAEQRAFENSIVEPV